MILSFANPGTADIFDRKATKHARHTCPVGLWPVARRKLDQLNAAVSLASLRIPPANHLEALVSDREGQHSLRINQQYRVCFVWTSAGPTSVEIVDYH